MATWVIWPMLKLYSHASTGHMFTWRYAYAYIQTHACLPTCKHISVSMPTTPTSYLHKPYTHTYTHSQTHTHTYVHAHAHTHTHTRTHTHTHIIQVIYLLL